MVTIRGEDDASLLLPQKKRMKRNAANKRKAAGQTTNATKVPHDDSINPNDMLRATLVTMGYQIEEINVALDEMWNLSLKYDEVDAVLNYLQERKPTVAPVLAAPPNVMSSRGSNDSEVPAAFRLLAALRFIIRFSWGNSRDASSSPLIATTDRRRTRRVAGVT